MEFELVPRELGETEVAGPRVVGGGGVWAYVVGWGVEEEKGGDCEDCDEEESDCKIGVEVE